MIDSQIREDSQKFNNFLSIFPEDKINTFIDDLQNGYYYGIQIISIINPHDIYSREILAIFSDKELESNKELFNESFEVLKKFLSQHFFVIDTGKDFESQVFGLYPEHRVLKDKLWKEKEDELEEIVNKFESYYHSFLLKAKEIFMNNQELKKCNFDDETGTLFIGDKKINIQKSSKEFFLLGVIFSDPKKKWDFSDISEKMDDSREFSNKDFDNYLRGIMNKVSAVGGPIDLFEKKSEYIKINKSYL